MLHDTLDSPVAGSTVASATFHDLMAGVGYFLLQWSLLDASLDEEISHLRRASGDTVGAPGRARTVNERLAEWRALLSRGRRRRPDHHVALDRIAESIQQYQRCYALVAGGFVAAPIMSGVAVLCAQADSREEASDDHRMTLRDIRETIEGMELCRSEMALLRGLREH